LRYPILELHIFPSVLSHHAYLSVIERELVYFRYAVEIKSN